MIPALHIGVWRGSMRIGAYQFRVTGDAERNFSRIKAGIEEASKAGVRLLMFPECALTGYPPLDIGAARDADIEKAERLCGQLREISVEYGIFLVVGTIIREGSEYFDAAVIFSPEGGRTVYRKRALWGWDRENFAQGQDLGIALVDSMRIGVRICFEVRFPEYFRELYKKRTDLDVILFYDVADNDAQERYDLIKGHVRTRAVENVCRILTCNTADPCQAAPTALFDRSGRTLAEAERGRDCLLVYDIETAPLSFGESGRKEISDSLTGLIDD